MAERAVCAAANVNVVGTANVVAAARDVGARFILISSDKAASPASIMGATKRLAELVVLAHVSPAFRPVVVRFGNVLGSSGSLLTILRSSIRAGQPVPVTDPDATRYFMTAGEAVSLVMKVDLSGAGAKTFWLDMGEPIRIGDLVERMMALEQAHGFAPVPMSIIGLRPGEKRQERLVEQGISMTATANPQIWVARQRPFQRPRVLQGLQALRRAAGRADGGVALDVLRSCVAGFEPSATARASAEAHRAPYLAASGLRRSLAAAV
jgi:FlaA1/EpsC-like NDP-sugar epimerase